MLQKSDSPCVRASSEHAIGGWVPALSHGDLLTSQLIFPGKLNSKTPQREKSLADKFYQSLVSSCRNHKFPSYGLSRVTPVKEVTKFIVMKIAKEWLQFMKMTSALGLKEISKINKN